VTAGDAPVLAAEQPVPPIAAGPAEPAAQAARPAVAPAETCAKIDRLIAAIDRLLSAQVDAILHHPRFQRLEASWRGVAWLAALAEGTRELKLRILNVSWAALVRDFERAIEFDQSNLFIKVYTECFDMPGGEPFGLIVGDFEPSQSPRDLATLRQLAVVAAAAFSPIVLGCPPRLFELESFARLGPHMDFSFTFNKTEYRGWRSMRDIADSRFLGMVLPRILVRLPYRCDGTRADGFIYSEAIEAPDGADYLWASGAYAFAGVAIRSYANYGWLADLRGVHADGTGGGLIDRLPAPFYATDRPGVALRSPIEVVIAEQHERDLAELGFIPLVAARLTPYVVFHSNQSLHIPERFDRAAARANARLSAMLQQILCASRFAHYLKVLMRNKIGSFATPEAIQRELEKWLTEYCDASGTSSEEKKARYPLREAGVEISEIPGKPGSYNGKFWLVPQFQLDELDGRISLTTAIQVQPQS
jgi:type VI secretion system protein ImpD